MPGSDREFSVTAWTDPMRGWIIVQMEVGQLFEFHVALTFLSQSRVSQDLIDFLTSTQFARPIPEGRYVLRQLTMGGQPIPDVQVNVSPIISRLPVDGVFGLDFLLRFSAISLNPALPLLTFTDP